MSSTCKFECLDGNDVGRMTLLRHARERTSRDRPVACAEIDGFPDTGGAIAFTFIELGLDVAESRQRAKEEGSRAIGIISSSEVQLENCDTHNRGAHGRRRDDRR
jgi:hypothetical protein